MVAPGWPLDELARRVAVALQRVALASASGRVRELPDARTIRYYTTLGLLDRPQAYRGRVALYGPRHLLQLVAIKRLQAEGRALSEVQPRLYGLSDAELAALAALPDGVGVVDLDVAPAGPPRPASRPFWKAPSPAPDGAPPAPAGPPGAPVALRLAPAALLILERPGAPLTEDEERALREAAAPLVRWLVARTPRPESDER